MFYTVWYVISFYESSKHTWESTCISELSRAMSHLSLADRACSDILYPDGFSVHCFTVTACLSTNLCSFVYFYSVYFEMML